MRCPDCGGEVELQITDRIDDDPRLESPRTCPFCKRVHAAIMPGRIVWAGRKGRFSTASQLKLESKYGIKVVDWMVRHA